MDKLEDYDNVLGKRFMELASQRPVGSVFLLEHGLHSDDVERMKSLLRQEIDLHRGRLGNVINLTSFFWPLLVLTTEVGYRYDGCGTDFWPLLANDLGRSFTEPEIRNDIRAKFEAAHRRCHIIKPLETPWAKQFRLIAWPITNAVLPRDIRRQFMESIESLPSGNFLETPEDITVSLRRRRKSEGSIRYRNWLENMSYIGPLARALMTDADESPFFSPELLTRLRQDMERDKKDGETFRRLRHKIREKYRRLVETEPIVKKRQSVSRERIQGQLFLTPKPDGFWRFEGRLPESLVQKMSKNVLFRHKLLSGELQLAGWNTLQLKPSCFLEGERFEIPPEYWSCHHRPLFQDDRYPEWNSVDLSFDFPLFFDGNGKRIQTLEKDSGTVVGLTDDYSDDVDGIDFDDGSPVGFSILRIDTSSDSAMTWCERNGAGIREKRPWRWICPCGRIEENILTVSEGDTFFLAVKEDHPVNIFFQGETRDNVTGLFMFDRLLNGVYDIHIHQEQWVIKVVEHQKPRPMIAAKPMGEWTVSALRKRELMLAVESPEAFINVDYHISLSDKNGIKCDYSGKFDSIPGQTVLFKEIVFKNKPERAETFWRLLHRQTDLNLRAEIGGVFKGEWRLEYPCFGVWWSETESETPKPESDGDPLTAEEELHRKGRLSLYPDGLRLFCAHEIETADQIGPRNYRAAAILHHPDTLTDNAVLRLPERAARRADDTEESVGLENVMNDILAFRQVLPESSLTELWRRRALSELEHRFWSITCGETWASRTADVDEVAIRALFVTELNSFFLDQWKPKIGPDVFNAVFSDGGASDDLKERFHELRRTMVRVYPEFFMMTKHTADKKTCEQLNGGVSEIFSCVSNRNEVFIKEEEWNALFDRVTAKLARHRRRILERFQNLIYLEEDSADSPDRAEESNRGIVEKFWKEDIPILIAHNDAREALNFQNANALIFYSLPWKPVDMEQWLGRVSRLGLRQKKTVEIRALVMRGMIDEKIAELYQSLNIFETQRPPRQSDAGSNRRERQPMFRQSDLTRPPCDGSVPKQ